jgi:Glycosyl transferase family 11
VFLVPERGLALGGTIIVGLRGGLGNQLFQYAMGRRLAIENQAELFLDTTEYRHHFLRSFELGQFRISAKVASDRLLQSTRQWYTHLPYGRYRYSLRNLWDGLARRITFAEETNHGFDKILAAVEPPCYLWGFWQDERYFVAAETELRSELVPIVSEDKCWADILSEINETESVSVHVRRGDYATRPDLIRDFGLCDEVYYQRSIELLRAKLAKPRFFVFSDDPGWCVNHLCSIDERITVVGPSLTASGIDHFQLMLRCRHHIIANSSFSWWSAWLSDSPGKQIVAPTPWFTGGAYCGFDPVPVRWLRVVR